jgi:hypothetical protein
MKNYNYKRHFLIILIFSLLFYVIAVFIKWEIFNPIQFLSDECNSVRGFIVFIYLSVNVFTFLEVNNIK